MRADPELSDVVPPVEAVRPPRRRALSPRDREALVYFAMGLLVVMVVFVNSYGWFTPDTEPQLYYAPGRTLIEALFAWQSNPFLGQAQFNAGIAPVAAVILVIRALGVSAWAAVRIWRVALLLVAGWGASAWRSWRWSRCTGWCRRSWPAGPAQRSGSPPRSRRTSPRRRRSPRTCACWGSGRSTGARVRRRSCRTRSRTSRTRSSSWRPS